MAEFRTPQVIGTILNAPLITVQGTVTTQGGSGGGGYSTVTGTVVVSTVQSPIAIAGGTVSTIQSPIILGGGTVGTITSPISIGGGTVTVGAGTITVGAGTITTIGGGFSTVTGTVIVGTIQNAPNVTNLQQFIVATIQNNTTVVAGTGASTLAMGSLQDLVVDATYGTVYPAAGSLLVQVMSVDPLSGFQTGTIVSSGWYPGASARAGDRLTAPGPLGAYVAVGYVLVSGTVAGFYLSAQQSFTG